MALKNHLSCLIQVHKQAYERIYSTLDAVSDADYFSDKGLFFSSIHGTLNHCLLVDMLWYYRLREQQSQFTVTGLNMILHSTRDPLQMALSAQAEKFCSFVEDSDNAFLNKMIKAKTSSGLTIHNRVSWLIATVVNHGTHHRGQITAVLTQMGLAYPPLDLPFYDNLPSAEQRN